MTSSVADTASIVEVVNELAHLLPQQAPLHAFVHHNTLHAFEHLHFEKAVVEAAETFGTEPFMTEEAFAQQVACGRITAADIEAIIADNPFPAGQDSLPAGLDLDDLRRARLLHYFQVPEDGALRWHLTDGGLASRLHPCLSDKARRSFTAHCSDVSVADTLGALWQLLSDRAPLAQPAGHDVRPRDQLHQLHRRDPDLLVHPMLLRFCAAYLDQGIGYWAMPVKEQPLLQAFRELYSLPAGPPDPWLRHLRTELQQQRGLDAAETIERLLKRMQIPPSRRMDFLRQTLLSLPGWAGMMRQFETRPDQAPVQSRPAKLLDYLAIQLTLDWLAADHLGQATEYASFEALRLAASTRGGQVAPNHSLAFEAFVTAQLLGLTPSSFTSAHQADALIRTVQRFEEFERRRLLHLAYERRHRIETLDAYAAHLKHGGSQPIEPLFQAVFCIDDREESTRRHLEETSPTVETFGFAGFFGVPMAYQGLDDVRPRPLCPVSVTPRHLVRELPVDVDTHQRRRTQLARLGNQRLLLSVGSQTMVRGAIFTALAGAAATIALIGRVVTPRLSARLAHYLESPRVGAPRTRLALEREREDVDDDGRHFGFTVDEMTDIVANVLTTMGCADRLAPIVLLVGHGSSSLNNPHEAAHDCGATGGGRGGPNARAFALMANHENVRARLAERGLHIPDSVWFIGSYHNTCDDSMTYFDEHSIPGSHHARFEQVKASMATACLHDAHERCRRFEDVPAGVKIPAALAAAETHAEDLAQPRPEYGHATNAVCVVGRRATTRGLFLDRRAFLVSYDPTRDPDAAVLSALLQSVGPVGAGINLEYYFSFIDPVGYGAGTKLPHNIVGLFGVMDGHASDLRSGLPWQMVEIHEPVRLLTIVEASTDTLERVLAGAPALASLIANAWIQVVSHDPDTDQLAVWHRGSFLPYKPSTLEFSSVQFSSEHYRGHGTHLPGAHVKSALLTGGAA